ncbi:hypothetical protein GCM10009828_063080 [Actinoplanes couchii]
MGFFAVVGVGFPIGAFTVFLGAEAELLAATVAGLVFGPVFAVSFEVVFGVGFEALFGLVVEPVRCVVTFAAALVPLLAATVPLLAAPVPLFAAPLPLFAGSIPVLAATFPVLPERGATTDVLVSGTVLVVGAFTALPDGTLATTGFTPDDLAATVRAAAGFGTVLPATAVFADAGLAGMVLPLGTRGFTIGAAAVVFRRVSVTAALLAAALLLAAVVLLVAMVLLAVVALLAALAFRALPAFAATAALVTLGLLVTGCFAATVRWDVGDCFDATVR